MVGGNRRREYALCRRARSLWESVFSPVANCFEHVRPYHGSVIELNKNLAWNMKRRRNVLGMSQMDLAAVTNLSSGYIGELESESGTKFPSGETLETLAAALKVRPFVLLMNREDLALDVKIQVLLERASVLREGIDRQLGEFVAQIGPGSDGMRGPYD